MRILLINPTIENECDALHLGLGSLATYLNQCTDHQAELVDFVYRRRNWQQYLHQRIQRFQPEAVALTSTSPYEPLVRTLSAELRRQLDVPLVIGGPHAAVVHETLLRDQVADFVVRGEGELALSELLDRLPDRDYQQIKGLAFLEGDELRVNGWTTPIADLDSLPPIDWDLWEDLDEHLYFFRTIPAMGSRGCPYRCSVCATPWLSRSTGDARCRHVTPELFVEHLADYHRRYAARHMGLFFFYDLNFLINEHWLEGFVEAYRRRGLDKVPFSVFSRADHVTPRRARLLKEAGCNMVRLGVESGSDYMRNEIYQKDLPRETIYEAAWNLKQAGISCQAYLILAGPGETKQTLEESGALMRELKVEYPTPFIFKVLAGNPIDDALAKTGATLDEEALARPADYLSGYHVINPELSEKQVERFRGKLFARAGLLIMFHALLVFGWRFFAGFWSYLRRGRRHGWTLFQIAAYYLYYGCGNLERPLFRRLRRRPGGPQPAPAVEGSEPPRLEQRGSSSGG